MSKHREVTDHEIEVTTRMIHQWFAPGELVEVAERVYRHALEACGGNIFKLHAILVLCMMRIEVGAEQRQLADKPTLAHQRAVMFATIARLDAEAEGSKPS